MTTEPEPHAAAPVQTDAPARRAARGRTRTSAPEPLARPSGTAPDGTAPQGRTITVQTSGLGPVRVRRVSLGGIASAAAHFRATGAGSDDALVDALIAEVCLPVDRAAGMHRRRLEDAELESLSDADRDALAAAVLTLEGVATAGDGVRDAPRVMLARRYARIIGTGERIDRSVREAVRPLAGKMDRLKRTLSPGAAESIARGLASAAALREVLKEDDWPQRLREDPDFSLDLDELLDTIGRPEPSLRDPNQLPLFDGEPPAADPEPAPQPGARAPRALERLAARVDDVAESQRQLLQWHAETRQTVVGGVADLATRAQETDRAGRRTLRIAWGAAAVAAVAAVALVAAIAWTFSIRRELAATRSELREAVQRHDAELAALRKSLVPAPAPRIPASRKAPTKRHRRSARR